MKTPFRTLLKIILPAALLLAAATAAAGQTARLSFDNLKDLEDRARDVVEVNIDGKVLALAKRVLVKVNDQNARRVGDAIRDLEGIYVRVYRFENENEYDPVYAETIRAQLAAPGWEKLANVRSKKNDQKIDVYTMFTGDVMSGVAVLISENKSLALVNVIGPIDIDLLAELGGKLNIPDIDIETVEDPDRDKE